MALTSGWPAWWHQGVRVPWSLRVVAASMRPLLWIRRSLYAKGLLPVHRLPLPVIVIGNIAVGGSGKTPMVLWLLERLREQGYRPGIISRGYASSAGRGPLLVDQDSTAETVGDEPLLLYLRSGAAIAVGRDRVAAARLLQAEQGVDIIVSDDGLQHYRLHRDLEIVLVDGRRGFGNGRLLPAGPLREPPRRLQQADVVVWKSQGPGVVMQLRGDQMIGLGDPQPRRALADFAGQAVHAVAGIADPESFFLQLREAGLRICPHKFPDHHNYISEDLADLVGQTVVMTEKDAIKCRSFESGADWWYLPVEAHLPQIFEQELLQRIKRIEKSL